MFTGPVGPVEVFFYWPETVFGNFYWAGAIGSPLASSPGRVVGSVVIDISPLNDFATLLFPGRFHGNRQAGFGR